MVKYYKKEQDGKLLFLRVTEIRGQENRLLQDLEVVPIRDDIRLEYGTYYMDEIKRDEFTDLVKEYNLGLIKSPSVVSVPESSHILDSL
jgi:hypothetical protein